MVEVLIFESASDPAVGCGTATILYSQKPRRSNRVASSGRKLMSFPGSVSTTSAVHARDGAMRRTEGCENFLPIGAIRTLSQWSIVRHRASALIARQDDGAH